MNSVYLQAFSVLAPGLSDWSHSHAVLSDKAPYTEAELPPFPKYLLPANELRRATPTMKPVLQVAADVLARQPEPAQKLYSVFASSAGDSDIVHRICSALLLPARPVSPTHFHNSVHNAPAGYWSISTRCQQPYSAISAHDASFSAALLDAAVTAQVEQTSVLVVVYDRPLPAPLAAVRQIIAPFAIALLVSPWPGKDKLNTAKLTLCIEPASSAAALAPTRLDNPALERLRCGNPAARSLPLLAALARQTSTTVMLPYLDAALLQLHIDVLNNDLPSAS
ncbi:MAG: beta-ketoacyl synthase chain length factor [Gammaproteobacteria bacterium]